MRLGVNLKTDSHTFKVLLRPPNQAVGRRASIEKEEEKKYCERERVTCTHTHSESNLENTDKHTHTDTGVHTQRIQTYWHTKKHLRTQHNTLGHGNENGKERERK